MDYHTDKIFKFLVAGGYAFLIWSTNAIMLAIMIPALIDVATGLYKARLGYKGKSSRWRAGIHRLVAYYILASCISLIGSLSTTQLVFANGLATMVTMGELVSIIENLKVICMVRGIDSRHLDQLVHMLRLNLHDLTKEAYSLLEGRDENKTEFRNSTNE